MRNEGRRKYAIGIFALFFTIHDIIDIAIYKKAGKIVWVGRKKGTNLKSLFP